MSQRNLTLLTDFYELTMMQGYFREQQANETVIFDAFYRVNPCGNGYAICAGLEQVIEYIENLHFDKEDRNVRRGLPGLPVQFQIFRRYLRDPGRKRRFPQRASYKGSGSYHGSAACGDGDLKYHQPPEPDRY